MRASERILTNFPKPRTIKSEPKTTAARSGWVIGVWVHQTLRKAASARLGMRPSVVDSSGALSFTLDASRGQAWRVTPAVPPAIQSLLRQGDGRVSLTATGNPGLPYSLWAETNLAIPAWALLTSGLINTTPFTYSDDSATNRPQQFYRFSTP